jgi:O-antigen/teichoic acid export membrane protein
MGAAPVSDLSPPIGIASVEPEPVAEKALGGTVLRGLVWLGGVRWIAQLFTWASTLIIARLLAPEDYGLVALATVLTGFLEVITDLGLGSALVQSRNPTKRDIEATMGATILLGLGAAVIVAASAPLWAQIQNDPRIVPIVQALAFGVLLTTAANVPYSMLHRRLAFGLVARAQFVRGLVTAGVTLGGAFILQSHWALVVGYLVGKFAFTVMLMWAEPTRPRFPGRDTEVGRLLRFGGVLTADRVLNYARTNIDVALVGALLGTRMVGLYVMATALARLPLEKLGSAFEPVAYPTFARLRDDKPELTRYFLGLSLGTMAIALPACLGLIVTAELLVPTVIGAQWLAVVRPLQIAAIVTPLAFHLGLVSALFNAMGRVDLNLRITTLTSVLTIGAVFAGVRFGIVGVAAASGIAFTLVWVYAEMIALRLIGLGAGEAVRTLLPALSASLAMAAIVYAVSLVLPGEWPAVIRLAVECGVGVLAYIGWAFAMHRNTVVRQLRSLRTAWSAG